MTNLSCTFCNLVINSQKQWDDHVVGQKHLRAVKLAEATAAGNNPPITTKNLPAPPRTPSPPDYNGTDMTDAIPGPNGSYECRVCTNFSCTGIVPMQAHLKGAKHLKALKKQAPGSQAPQLVLSPLPGSVVAPHNTSISSPIKSNSAATSVLSGLGRASAGSSVCASHNTAANSPVKSNSASSVLSVFGAATASSSVIASHNTSINSPIKSNSTTSVLSVSCAVRQPDGQYKCSICDDGAIISGQIPMQQHLMGAKHLKNAQRRALEKLQGSSANPSVPANGYTSFAASHTISSTSSPTKSNNSTAAVISDPCAVLQAGGMYKCSICDDGAIISGQAPMQQHLMGQKHLKIAQRKALEKNQGWPTTPSGPANGYTSFVTSHTMPSTTSPTKSNMSTASVISDPCAVLQADGMYKCSICDDGAIISGQAPMQQHLMGKKHLKNAQRRNPVAPQPLSASPTPMAVTSAVIKNRTPSPDIDMSSAILHSNGSYGCADCADFTCCGIIPMKEHLAGKNHQKSLKKKSPTITNKPPVVAKKPSFETQGHSPLVSLSAEESVAKAWHHPIKCGYMYNDSFSNLPLADKIKSLSPHFAFLAHDEPIPNLSKYLV